jgi:ribosome maturation factor RimP
MVERADGRPVTVDDCIQVSRAVSPRLDADKTIADRYTLEVSSPGIDRPLMRLKDFERFKGHMVRIDLGSPIEQQAGKQKRFQGHLVRIDGSSSNAEIELRTEGGKVRLPMNNIVRARLVATDAPARASEKTKH